MKSIVKLYNLGKLSYQRALSAQLLIFDKLKQDVFRESDHARYLDINKIQRPVKVPDSGLITNSLILVEHEPVYTVGIRTQQYSDKYLEQLKQSLGKHKLEAPLIKTNRGGLITFHGPGQLVAYPIIQLNDFGQVIAKKSVKAYVKTLESIIIDTLGRAGLQGAHTVDEYPGVWVDNGERKIAFIGISCKRYVTMHGISINCDCDLTWFDHITSCGIEDKSITSIRQEFLSSKAKQLKALEEQQANSLSHNVHYIANLFCASFSSHFKCDLREEEFPWDLITDCKQKMVRKDSDRL